MTYFSIHNIQKAVKFRLQTHTIYLSQQNEIKNSVSSTKRSLTFISRTLNASQVNAHAFFCEFGNLSTKNKVPKNFECSDPHCNWNTKKKLVVTSRYIKGMYSLYLHYLLTLHVHCGEVQFSCPLLTIEFYLLRKFVDVVCVWLTNSFLWPVQYRPQFYSVLIFFSFMAFG